MDVDVLKTKDSVVCRIYYTGTHYLYSVYCVGIEVQYHRNWRVEKYLIFIFHGPTMLTNKQVSHKIRFQVDCKCITNQISIH